MPLNVTGGALEFDAVIADSQFSQTIKRIEAQLQGLTVTAEKEAKSIDNLVKRTVAGIAAYASLSTATNFISDIVRVRGEFQQLEVAFTTMLGSKADADALMRDVTNFAATTPFELKEVAGATKQLLAFGISADKIEGTLRSLGDVSAGIGAPLGEIAYLFGTIKTQGVALTQDVRQFAQRGIPIYEELAKILGVSNEEVGNFISAGKVGFPEVEQVFKNLTAEGSKFGGLMAEQAKTLTGQISNFQDAWQQMLNSIGKSGEGIFSDIISGATFVVEHYEDVIDILKVLIITYGSYRAAIIATTAVQAIQTSVTKGYTIAETIRYQAMLLSERAMKILNATMLKNPAAWVVAGITAIVSAFAIFRKESSNVRTSQELLAAAQEKVGDKMAETEAKIRPYVEALKGANLSEQERVDIYKKLEAIDPKIVEGLDAKTLSYEKLKGNVDLYIAALREQYKTEANKEAILESIKEEHKLEAELNRLLEERTANINRLKKAEEDRQKSKNKAFRNAQSGLNNAIRSAEANESEEIKAARKAIEAQKKETEKLASTDKKIENGKQENKLRTLEIINEEIKAEKERQEKFSATSAQYQVHQKKINELEEERSRIIGASKQAIAAANKEENAANSLLEKRKDLLEAIAEKQRDAAQTGLTKQQTEIEKINERYDDLIKNIDEYNKKVDQFNKKNPKNQVSQIGLDAINALNEARKTEIDNTNFKEDAERFKKHLDVQKRMFEQYEEAKKQVGEAKAKELFSDQLADYRSYLDLLQKEGQRLAPKISFGIANVGEVDKFKAIVEEIKKLQQQQAEDELNRQKQNFTDLLAATFSFNDARAAINRKYDELESTLEKDKSLKNKDDRKKILEQGRKEELEALESDILRQSELYKKLNQDILGFTRARLREEIKVLRARLKDDQTLTPQMKADIQATIDAYKDLLDSTNETSQKYAEISETLSATSGIFGQLANAVEGLNSELSESLQIMSEMTSVASSVAGAIAQFASGDILGGIGSVVSAVTSIFNMGARARERRRQQQQEIENFLTAQFVGEQEINLLYQERERAQIRLNKLRVQGLEDERALLERQRDEVATNYDVVFRELQKLTARVRKEVGGFGIEMFVNESLAGKSFDELEQLFIKGQLEGRAKDLFLELQKIKDSGVDIDRMLAENAQAARELFTGTTADSIVDSIAEGFKNGLNSAEDFAGTFQELMQNAILQSLKLKYLEGPLKEFFEEFAALSQSDGGLTNGEIQQLQNMFNQSIDNFSDQFEQLQQIAGINFNGSGNQGNSLTGAIKGMTEQQADLLAGQFGGLRINAAEQLRVAQQSLQVHLEIQANTGLVAQRVLRLLEKYDAYETGSKRLKVDIN